MKQPTIKGILLILVFFLSFAGVWALININYLNNEITELNADITELNATVKYQKEQINSCNLLMLDSVELILDNYNLIYLYGGDSFALGKLTKTLEAYNDEFPN
jgi:hypothetical protein